MVGWVRLWDGRFWMGSCMQDFEDAGWADEGALGRGNRGCREWLKVHGTWFRIGKVGMGLGILDRGREMGLRIGNLWGAESMREPAFLPISSCRSRSWPGRARSCPGRASRHCRCCRRAGWGWCRCSGGWRRRRWRCPARRRPRRCGSRGPAPASSRS